MPLTPHQQFLIDFKFDQVPALLGLELSDKTAAEVLGISDAALEAEVQQVAAHVKAAAEQLRGESAVATAIARWQLAPKTKLLFAGDSITAMRKSYAEILNVLLKHERSDVELTCFNEGESGSTSGNGLQDTYTAYLERDPDWTFIFYGTNDSQHIEDTCGRSLVSLEEYEHNLRAIVQAFQKHTHARPVLITPPPLVDEIANATYGHKKIAYSSETVSRYANVVRTVAQDLGLPCVDLYAAFGIKPDTNLFGPDGLHPNLAGQMEIVRALVRSVVRG